MKLLQLKLDEVQAKSNVRQDMESAEMNDLVNSIKEKGIIQPLIVRLVDEKYDLVAGFRRLAAAKKLGLPNVPCVLQEIDDADRTSIQLIENIQREALNPIDEAVAISDLSKKHKVEDVALMIGKTRDYVEKRIKLLSLPGDIIEGIEKKVISAGHGVVLTRLVNKKAQVKLYNEVVSERLSIAQTESRLSDYSRRLDNVQFDTTECKTCKHSGSNQKDFFDEDADLKGHCLDEACFEKKQREHISNRKKLLKKEGVRILSDDEYRKEIGKFKSISTWERKEILDEDWKKEIAEKKNIAVYFRDDEEIVLMEEKTYQRLAKRAKQVKKAAEKSADGKVDDDKMAAQSARERAKQKQITRVDDTKRRFYIAALNKSLTPAQSDRIILEALLEHEPGNGKTISTFLIRAGVMAKEKLNYEIRTDLPALLSQVELGQIRVEIGIIAKRYIDNHTTEELEAFSSEIKVDMKQFKVDKEYLEALTKDGLDDLCKEFKLKTPDKFDTLGKGAMIDFILTQKLGVPKELSK